MPASPAALHSLVEKQALAHIAAGADPDDLASALLEVASAILLTEFGPARAAELLSNLAAAATKARP